MRCLPLKVLGYKTGASRSVAQSGSAPRSGRGGRRFKSCHSDQGTTRHGAAIGRPLSFLVVGLPDGALARSSAIAPSTDRRTASRERREATFIIYLRSLR